jgi:hypothetical protein
MSSVGYNLVALQHEATFVEQQRICSNPAKLSIRGVNDILAALAASMEHPELQIFSSRQRLP